jgi:CubicO group peptidase (beta-lactamase class C family)
MRSNSNSLQALRLTTAASLTIFTVLAAASSAHSKPQSNSGDAQVAARIQRVEKGIPPIPLGANEPPLQLSLQRLMEVYKVPAVSVAVIDDFKVAWAKAYGVTEAGGSTPVTTHTMFQAGSISKTVAATGALWLVEHGKLSLDEDVNQKLVTWKVPENEFTKDQKVTLRRLQSHSAGLTVHGFPGYAVGDSVPTLVQIFNGEKPANTAPIRVDFVPGTKFRYSGGGVTIEQQLMMDVSGQPFPQFMRETVLGKIGMTDSTFDQPLPPDQAKLAASGTLADGKVVPGKWHIYPEMAAAGLWTTPTDLAKFGIEIALSKQGKANHVLSQTMTREMLTPQIDHVGLAFFLGEGNNPEEFGHDGDDDGFQADLIMFADSGKGIAVMANSDNGHALAHFLVQSVAKEYGWNYTTQPNPGDLLSLIASVRGAQTAMQKYAELKSTSPNDLDENTLIQLAYGILFTGNVADAIQIFKLEVQEYPKYWNAYDSLGEAYMNARQNDLAIQNYEMSLTLKPDNQNGIDMLRKLRQQKQP